MNDIRNEALDGLIDDVLRRDATRMPKFDTMVPVALAETMNAESGIVPGLFSTVISKITFFAIGAACVGTVWYFNTTQQPLPTTSPVPATHLAVQPNVSPGVQAEPHNEIKTEDIKHQEARVAPHEHASQPSRSIVPISPTPKQRLELHDEDDPNARHFPLEKR